MTRTSPPSRHMLPRLPPHAPGMAIGLYGGSFNPPHAAHRMVSLLALKRLRLDRVWQLVSPGNPLKDNAALSPLAARVAASQALADDPRIVATGVEAGIGAVHTRDVVAYLKQRCPGVAFVWIMGADNLATFHGWKSWREIADFVPIAVIDRPGATFSPLGARAAQALRRFRLDESDAAGLARAAPPAWCFLHGPRSHLSSTALRGGKASDQGFRSGFGRSG